MADDDGFTQVHVSGLPPHVGDAEVEEALRALLSVGPTVAAPAEAAASEVALAEAQEEELPRPDNLLDCRVVRKKDTGECKGYCFLSFFRKTEAEDAIARLNAGASVAGAPIQAQLSQQQRPKSAAKAPGEELHDLRIGRRNFQSVRKHPGSTTCSDRNVKLVNGRKLPGNAVAGGR
mmetsp:Transcript_21007/g.45783  ORF Transcript_21007/g.45783 Transcript_21007/m.45783 type:complete len:177 (-) Transcript_21007:15-545(-)